MTEPNVISIKVPIACTTTKEVNGLWSAILEIRPDDYIKTESYVDIDDELYIAKKIEKLRSKVTTFQVQLEHNMTELNGFFVGPFTWTDKTCAEMLALALTGTPWSVGVTDITGTKTVESTKKISVMAALQIIVRAFIGELYFHSKTRIVDIKSEIGTAHKLPVRYDKNTDYIKKIENSEKLCTRLYIYGEGDYATDGVAGNVIWALGEDTDYVYCAGSVINKCIRYLKSDMSFAAVSPSYEDVIYALTEDSTHVYIAGGFTTRKIRKYLKSDMSYVAETGDLRGVIFALVNDANYIYYGGTVTNRVCKYSKALSFAAEGPDYTGSIRAIAEDTNFIYCGGYVLGPDSAVWKLQKSDLAKVDESPEYEGGIGAITEDANYIYCSWITTSNDSIIRKFLKSNMSLAAASSGCGGIITALTEDDTYVYAGGGYLLNKVCKYLKSNLSLVAQSPGYGSPVYALTVDDTYIYAGGGKADDSDEDEKIISKVCKYLKSNLSLVKETPNFGVIGYIESDNINDYKYVKEYPIYTSIDDGNRLLEYALLYLATYKLPLNSYLVNIMDKVVYPEWGSEVIGIGDTIRLYDNVIKVNEDARIKRFVKDLVTPKNSTIELTNMIERITDILNNMNYTVRNVSYENNNTTLDVRDTVIKDTVLKDVTFAGGSTHYGKSTLMFTIPGELAIGNPCMPIPMPYTCSIDKVYIYAMGAPQGTAIIVQIYVNDKPIFVNQDIRPHIEHLQHYDEATPNLARINKNELVYVGIVQVGVIYPGNDLIAQVRCR